MNRIGLMIVFSSWGSRNNYVSTGHSPIIVRLILVTAILGGLQEVEPAGTSLSLGGKAMRLTGWWAAQSTLLWKVIRRHALCALGELWMGCPENGVWSNSSFIQPGGRAWRRQGFLNGCEWNNLPGKVSIQRSNYLRWDTLLGNCRSNGK